MMFPFSVAGERRLGIGVSLAFALDAPGELRAQSEVWPLVLPLAEGAALDLGQPKPVGEWLLAGRSHAPGGELADHWEAEVAIGASHKRFAIYGPRVWSDGRITVAPARDVPVGWANAWGGEGIATNPNGCGWRPGASGPVEGPCVEHPDHRWTGPDRPCRPCSPGPIAMTDPRRLASLGTIGDDYARSAFPGYPPDFDPQFFQCADEDQRIATPWTGDENFYLRHWHPERTSIEGRLPGLRAAVYVGGAAGPLAPVAMRLTTLWFFPEALLGVLVFHGESTTARLDGSDVERVIVGFEAIDAAPRPTQDYEALWKGRTAHTPEAGLASLDDAALLPPGFRVRFDALDAAQAQIRNAIPISTRPRPDFTALVDDMHVRMRNGGAADDQAGLDRVRARIAALAQRSGGGEGGDGEVADTPLDRRRRHIANANMLLRQVRDDLSATDGDEMRAAETALAALRADHPRPAQPDPAALAAMMDSLGNMRAAADRAADDKRSDWDAVERLIAFGPPGRNDAEGADGAAPDRQALEAGLARMLERVDRDPPIPGPQAFTMPDIGVELPDPAGFAPLDPAGLRRPEAGWAPQCRAGEILEKLDLRGRDFSGCAWRDLVFVDCDLRGIDLRGARLEKTVFLRCDGEGLRAEGGDWSHVQCVATRLDGLTAPARLAASCLSRCDARGSDWTGRTLSQVIVSRADWTGTELSQARLDRCTFIETTLAQSRFTDAEMALTHWTGGTLDGGDWAGVRVNRCSLLNVAMPHRWHGAVLTGVTLRGVDLRGRDLTGIRFHQIELGESDLREADMSDATLTDCHAARIDLRRCRLDRATLTRVHAITADLREASLRGTAMHGCWFPEVRLDESDRAGLLATTSSFLPEARA